jgi:hypothetical protein
MVNRQPLGWRNPPGKKITPASNKAEVILRLNLMNLPAASCRVSNIYKVILDKVQPCGKPQAIKSSFAGYGEPDFIVRLIVFLRLRLGKLKS